MKTLPLSLIFFLSLSFLSSCNSPNGTREIPSTQAQDSQTSSAPQYGIFDPTIPFPGAGQYTGFDSLALSTSLVCTGHSLFGTAGTATCQNSTSLTPASASDVLSGKQFWDSTGTLQTGTLTVTNTSTNDINHPTQTTLVLTPSAGSAYNGITIDLGSDYIEENMCSKKRIFYKNGIRICGNTTDEPGSFSISLVSSTNIFHSPFISSSLNQPIFQESNITYSDPFYRIVPDPSIDDDGSDGIHVNKAPRPALICGKDFNTIQDRINDCATRNGSSGKWMKNNGNTGEGNWFLVSVYDAGNNGDPATSSAREVWLDERTQLLWSDVVAETNWCEASGNTENEAGIDCRPGRGLQNPTPTSYCVEDPSLNTPSNDPNKGEMTSFAQATAPAVLWRLPSRDDWNQAEIDGIRRVLPRMSDPRNNIGICDESSVWCNFWSTTVIAYARNSSFNFNGESGGISGTTRSDNSNSFVRCVGSFAH